MQPNVVEGPDLRFAFSPTVEELRALRTDVFARPDVLARLLTVPAPARDTLPSGEEAARVVRDDRDLFSAVQQLAANDAVGAIEASLAEAWLRQIEARPDTRHAPKVSVTFTLANRDASRSNGELLLGMTGSSTDAIWVGCWPAEQNVSSIGACAVHEFVHALRNANAPSAGFGLADWIVSEGVSECVMVAVCGPNSPFLAYTRLSEHQVDEALPAVMAAFDTTASFPEWSRYVFGDASAGLPPMIGYAVGRRLVEGYMAATGASAHDTVFVPTRDIVQAAPH